MHGLSIGIGIGLPRRRAAGSVAFSPLSLPSPVYWFDAADAATLFQESSGSPPGTTPAGDLQTVGAWRDKSGNGRHLTQAVGTSRPLRDAVSSPSVLMPDGGDRLFGSAFTAIPQPFTIGVVSDNTVNNSCFYDHGTAGTRILAQRGASNTSVSLFAGASLAATVADTAVRRAYLFEYNTTASKIWVYDGATSNFVQAGATGNAGTNQLADLRLFGNGAAFLVALQASEFFANAAVFSTQQRADTALYLKTKWSLT